MNRTDQIRLPNRANAYRFVSKSYNGTAAALAEAHGSLFGHNLTPDCPPYETQFRETHIFQQAQAMADIAGFYKAFGLDVSESACERADHLSVELEFMGYLCLKEWHALAAGREGDAEVCRDAQRKFLGDHLGAWAGSFAERLSGRASGTPYAGMARALGAFVRAECARLGAVPSSSAVYRGAPEPEEEEGRGTCVFEGDAAENVREGPG